MDMQKDQKMAPGTSAETPIFVAMNKGGAMVAIGWGWCLGAKDVLLYRIRSTEWAIYFRVLRISVRSTPYSLCTHSVLRTGYLYSGVRSTEERELTPDDA